VTCQLRDLPPPLIGGSTVRAKVSYPESEMHGSLKATPNISSSWTDKLDTCTARASGDGGGGCVEILVVVNCLQLDRGRSCSWNRVKRRPSMRTC
jgi:hypothetical protein